MKASFVLSVLFLSVLCLSHRGIGVDAKFIKGNQNGLNTVGPDAPPQFLSELKMKLADVWRKSPNNSANDESSAVVVDAPVTDNNGPKGVVDLQEEAKRQEKLKEAVSDEILSTEKSYVEGLKNMVKFYIEPIEKSIAVNNSRSPDYIGVKSSDISVPMREMFDFIKTFAIPFHEDVLRRLKSGDTFAKVIILRVGDFIKA